MDLSEISIHVRLIDSVCAECLILVHPDVSQVVVGVDEDKWRAEGLLGVLVLARHQVSGFDAFNRVKAAVLVGSGDVDDDDIN